MKGAGDMLIRLHSLCTVKSFEIHISKQPVETDANLPNQDINFARIRSVDLMQNSQS